VDKIEWGTKNSQKGQVKGEEGDLRFSRAWPRAALGKGKKRTDNSIRRHKGGAKAGEEKISPRGREAEGKGGGGQGKTSVFSKRLLYSWGEGLEAYPSPRNSTKPP